MGSVDGWEQASDKLVQLSLNRHINITMKSGKPTSVWDFCCELTIWLRCWTWGSVNWKRGETNASAARVSGEQGRIDPFNVSADSLLGNSDGESDFATLTGNKN